MKRLVLTTLFCFAAVCCCQVEGAQTARTKSAQKSNAAIAKKPSAVKRTEAKPTAKKSAPPRETGGDVVSSAGDRAAAAAAAERVHAWMRDHGEVSTAEEAPKPEPVKRAVGKTVAARPVKAEPKRATTEDFEKAAEKARTPGKSAEAPKQKADAEPQAKVEEKKPDSDAADDEAETVAKEPRKEGAPKPVAVARSEEKKPVVATKVADAKAEGSAPVLAVKRTEVEPEPVGSLRYQPKLEYRRGRLIVPAPLLGSHAILVHQNEVADKDGLDRIQDDEDLARMRRLKLLVPIPTYRGLAVDERLPENRRFARPWTARFLADLAKAHEQRFHGELQVNSAVRTVEFQQRLIRTNGNAAPAEGATASPHLTGQAVDIAKHGLSMTEIAWLRAYLLPLVQSGKIDVEEEFQQACFHISVYRSYMPASKTAKPRARLPRAALAASLR